MKEIAKKMGSDKEYVKRIVTDYEFAKAPGK
jgi:hypothetical protein